MAKGEGLKGDLVASVTILLPTNLLVLMPAQPLHVRGIAAGRIGLIPRKVISVTVSVDGGPPVEASLTHLGLAIPSVEFAVDVQAPSGAGAHEISAVATCDDGTSASDTVSVVVKESTLQFTPRESLHVSVVNPQPPSSGDWAADIVRANRSSIATLASLLSLAVWSDRGDDYPVCTREWNQVIAPGEDYDRDTVGFSGWLLSPEISGADVPFTHPFGLPGLPTGNGDWECLVALDPEYEGLLAAGNAVDDGAAAARARHDAQTLPGIKIPDGGLFAVETDSACLPSALKPPFVGDNVQVGDRIAVFGRWIVDAGHSVPVSGGHSYRAEVHPPMLMAIGGTRRAKSGDPVTRIVLTSRPYLVKQVYTTATETIHDDSASDDGTLLEHFNKEMNKLSQSDIWHFGGPDSTSIEAHPKIASKPFDGVHFFRLSVRPPPRNFGVMQVSFQFTCRSGVGVQVVGLDDHVDVLVVLNSAGYHAPPLPPRETDTWKKERLNTIDSGSAKLISFEQIASILTLFSAPPPFAEINFLNAERALANGIETDTYDVPDVDALNRSHAVPFVPINGIPGGKGVVIDDSQPYPVFGFLEIGLLPVDVNVDL